MLNDTPSDDVVILPRYAINLARRVVQLLAATDVLHVQIIRMGETWYIVGPGGKLERL